MVHLLSKEHGAEATPGTTGTLGTIKNKMLLKWLKFTQNTKIHKSGDHHRVHLVSKQHGEKTTKGTTKHFGNHQKYVFFR